MCVALPGSCTAFNLSYLNKGTEDGAAFIPQTLLIRRKRILNENCVFWLAQEAEWSELCGSLIWDNPSTLHRQGNIHPKPSCVLWLSVIQVCGSSSRLPTPLAAGDLRTLSVARRCFC